MELAREEVSFAGVLSSLKPGGIYAVPERSYNPAGVWATQEGDVLQCRSQRAASAGSGMVMYAFCHVLMDKY